MNNDIPGPDGVETGDLTKGAFLGGGLAFTDDGDNAIGG
jgi:hypothetical protein